MPGTTHKCFYKFAMQGRFSTTEGYTAARSPKIQVVAFHSLIQLLYRHLSPQPIGTMTPIVETIPAM